MIKVYGIPNCNTVKKALDWLNGSGLTYEFHNYKKQGITGEKLSEWCAVFGWENLLNTAGTTWKSYSDEEKNAVVDEPSAIELMLKNQSVIKRPIVEAKGKYLMRFNEEEYAMLFKTKSTG